MELIDFDGLFNKIMEREIRKHAGEKTEEEWENAVAEMYARFGRTPLSGLGKSPAQYFRDMTDAELAAALRQYVHAGVSVPDFLCTAMEERTPSPAFLSLFGDGNAEVVQYALTVFGWREESVPCLCALLADGNADSDLKDSAAEQLAPFADRVTDEMLSLCGGADEPYALQVLSRTKKRDDRVFAALRDAFLSADSDSIPLYAGYLAAYGDDRALPFLSEEIRKEETGFVAYEELRCAIESLGGTCDVERDFSGDEAYQKIMEATKGTDIFGTKKDG